KSARNSRSGAIEGRPSAAYSFANSPSSEASTSLTMRRINRSGWFAGTRSSMSTYENSSPVRTSEPRIDSSRLDPGRTGIIFALQCQRPLPVFQRPAKRPTILLLINTGDRWISVERKQHHADEERCDSEAGGDAGHLAFGVSS